MTNKRKLTYPDQDLPCSHCDRHFKNEQGLKGHLRMIHGIPGAPGTPSPGAPSSLAAEALASEASSGGSAGQSVAELRAEVEGLQLQLKRRKLVAELPAAVAESPDIMAQSGLGAFDAEVKSQAQRRAMGFDQERPQSWLDRLLANPEGIKVAVDALRGILGDKRESGGDNLSGLLRDMGYSLKDLITQASAPKAGDGLTIGGVSLGGASLTPQLLDSIMKYKAAEETAKAEFEGRKAMADSFDNAFSKLAPAVIELMANRQGGGPPGPIQSGPLGRGLEVQGSQQAVECPKCGHKTPVPIGFPGGELQCEGKLADGSQCWEKFPIELIEQPEASTPGRKKKKAKPEPPAELKCRCGQLIDISGRGIGDTIRCPVCQEELQLTSETESLPAEEPLTDREKQDRAWRDRFKGG